MRLSPWHGDLSRRSRSGKFAVARQVRSSCGRRAVRGNGALPKRSRAAYSEALHAKFPLRSAMIDIAPYLRTTRIAYFSMEIGIRAEMHTYSGGLGILAGDAARTAADLG